MGGDRAPAAAARLRIRHALAVLAAAALGGVLVSLAFVRVDVAHGFAIHPRFELAVLRDRFPVHAAWIVPFALAAGLLPALRALVWRAVLPPPAPRFADIYHATAIGALVHNTVPGKLGPIAAAWILARRARRPFTPALAAQLAAKLLEMGAVVALGAASAVASRPAGALAGVIGAGAALFFAFASFAVVLALGAPRASARLARRFPRAGATLGGLGEGLSGAGSPGRLLAAAALALAPALAASAAYTLPLRAAGVEHGLGGGAMLVAVLTFGQLTPGLPIGTGVYWSLAAWTARELGAAPADAAAVAVLTHAAMVGTNLLVGGGSALLRRGALGELVRRRREVERLASGAAGTPPRAPPRAPT
ncbi:MAG TPA: lysylphosphatidylglycerol synthase domain-containing protein [Anaeromyxobacter sp.]